MTGRSMTEHSTTEQRRPSGRQAPRNQDTPIPLAQSPLNDAAHNIQGRIRPRRQGRPTPNCRPTAPAHWPTAAPATASRPPPSAAIRDALHSRFFSLKNESGKMSPEKHGRTQWATQLQTTTILPDLFPLGARAQLGVGPLLGRPTPSPYPIIPTNARFGRRTISGNRCRGHFSAARLGKHSICKDTFLPAPL